MKTPIERERRITTRMPVDLAVVEHANGRRAHRYRATDLSLDGMRLGGPGSLAFGACVDLELALDPPLRLRAEVMTAPARGGVGVRFLEVKARDRLRIAEHLFGDHAP
jgi:hypothetical protein